LAGKPADFTDVTQARGRQHRPHAEQLDQAGVGLGNRHLDARLDGGDALVQLAHVGDEVGGQLPAGDRRRTSRRDRGQQPSRAVGGQVASGATRNQGPSAPVEPVDGLGAGRDQVLAPLGQQMQPSGF
jgi:hypothetical protein